MDLIDQIEQLKDKKLKKGAETLIRKTLEMNDEEFYFEEETLDVTGRKYITDHLIKVEKYYQIKGDDKKENYCIVCWDEKGQLNKVKEECLVCKIV